MYEDIMKRRRGLGDVVVNASYSEGFDMQQDQFADDIQQLFEPVGGGPYPFVRVKRIGPVQFGDIAVNSSYSEGYDMQQDAFADDMLTSGDEGIGFVQAQRLKQKLRGNRRRITESGYAVEADAPYAFGDLGKIRISFRHPFGKKSLFRKATRLVGKVAPYAVGGIVGGSLLKKGVPALFKFGKGLFKGGGGGETVAVATPEGVPAPAPTGATDAVGTPIPAAIQAASTAAVSPIPSSAPTASEDVASQVQEDQTQSAMEAGVAGPFTMPNFSDPKVLLTLAGVGVLIFSQMGKKGRRRSRRR